MSRRSSSLLPRVALLLAAAFVASGCGVLAQQKARAPQATPAPSAQPSPAEGEKIDRATSEPYTGDLSIFESADRAEKLQVERVMDVLGLKEGAGVADIGAGSGWFTVRAARRVGASGKVYAVEINPEYVKHIEARAARESLPQVRPLLGKEDDPALPAASVDAVLILKTYHEISQPVRLLTRLRAALKPGARVGVIDREGKGDDHGIARDTVVREAERAGFTLVEQHDFVKGDGMDYFLVFQARK
ncbi:MAG TPA: methyltransferase domain-containing protein [Pyrinomonadaceae bacterium]|nr:methyltransferase domain-containing protein [Pyrinomonadaceae bacterium]